MDLSEPLVSTLGVHTCIPTPETGLRHSYTGVKHFIGWADSRAPDSSLRRSEEDLWMNAEWGCLRLLQRGDHSFLGAQVLTCASAEWPHQAEETEVPGISSTEECSGKTSGLVSKDPRRMPEISGKENILESTDDTHRWSRLYDGMSRETHFLFKRTSCPQVLQSKQGDLCSRVPSSGLHCDLLMALAIQGQSWPVTVIGVVRAFHKAKARI